MNQNYSIYISVASIELSFSGKAPSTLVLSQVDECFIWCLGVAQSTLGWVNASQDNSDLNEPKLNLESGQLIATRCVIAQAVQLGSCS